MRKLDPALASRILVAHERIQSNFNSGNWEEIGLLTQSIDLIDGHRRLLRSLSWGDSDYSGNALQVVRQIVERHPEALPIIEQYLDQKFPGESHYISAKPSERKITFAPHVFQVPESHKVETDLVAVMMPFSKDFDSVYAAICLACTSQGLRCLRADNIWEESVIIQDIFNLIFRAQVIVVDFTGKNSNVMYEAGISHTLGKHVVPISQSLDHVPFDMRHHRVRTYLPNKEGLALLVAQLTEKLKQLALPVPPAPADDDIAF